MAHARPRALLDLTLKRLRFVPVLAIQGARQTGKSFLARELVAKVLPTASYVTLDDKTKQTLAEESPSTFLASFAHSSPLIIDEAQKSPSLFDAIKLAVDQERRPGAFLLLGSTEFSIQQGIRESLTGRMGKIRLYPLTYFETLGPTKNPQPPTRAQMLKFLETGGMPAIAFTRDAQVRSEFFQDWIDLTCERDIHQFRRLKLDSALAYEILKTASTIEEPTAAAIARHTRASPKKVATHLKALCELFVLNRIDPHPSGTGKSIYLPLDCGVAHHLGAPLIRLLHIAYLNERWTRAALLGEKKKTIQFYRSTGKRFVHIVESSIGGEMEAVQLFDREAVKKPDLELLKAFRSKNPKAKVALLAPVLEGWTFNGVNVRSWESMPQLPKKQKSASKSSLTLKE
jgi:predicted AAA+ superfamily ATPase